MVSSLARPPGSLRSNGGRVLARLAIGDYGFLRLAIGRAIALGELGASCGDSFAVSKMSPKTGDHLGGNERTTEESEDSGALNSAPLRGTRSACQSSMHCSFRMSRTWLLAVLLLLSRGVDRSWKYVGHCGEGQTFEIHGVNVWSHDWKRVADDQLLRWDHRLAIDVPDRDAHALAVADPAPWHAQRLLRVSVGYFVAIKLIRRAPSAKGVPVSVSTPRSAVNPAARNSSHSSR